MDNSTLILGEVDLHFSNIDYCNYYCNNYVEVGCKHHDLPENYSKAWTHMELGAANYGQDGHTKKSQRMTVLIELAYVSAKSNYIDNLPEQDSKPYDPTQQFAILFKTLDILIQRKGPIGIFHVNDLFAEYSDFAADALKKGGGRQSQMPANITDQPVAFTLDRHRPAPFCVNAIGTADYFHRPSA